jgi:hypothetical protein
MWTVLPKLSDACLKPFKMFKHFNKQNGEGSSLAWSWNLEERINWSQRNSELLRSHCYKNSIKCYTFCAKKKTPCKIAKNLWNAVHRKYKKIILISGTQKKPHQVSLSDIQGEHKVFPWLQTLITRKLRATQTYFLPVLITNLMHNSFIL